MAFRRVPPDVTDLGLPSGSPAQKQSQFGYFKTSREIIDLAVMMHVRFPLVPTFLTCSLVPDQLNLLKSSVSAQKDK